MSETPDNRAEALEQVLDVSRAMVATTDLDDLLGLIVRRSIDLLAAQRATVFLYDSASNELISRVAAGADEIRFPADRGIAGATARSGKTLVIPDAYADDRFNPDVDRDTGFRTSNILSVPLVDHLGGLVGVLQVLNKTTAPFNDHDIWLAETLGAQAGVSLQRAELIKAYVLKEQMERAMRIARDIQQGLLPTQPPQVDGFDIAGFSEAADQTGGDIYDYMPLPDGRWTLMIADASGHGIGPALVIAETRAMLRAVSLHRCDLDHVLGTVNRLLAADLDGGRFVTCFMGVIDAAAATLTYAAAGHGPLLFYDHAADTFRQEPATALPLGILDDTDFSDVVTRTLSPGDMAVITTDGFFEAADAAGDQFGIDRMLDVLRRDRDLPADQSIANLHQAVVEFTGTNKQADDLTAIVIKREKRTGVV